MVGERVLVAHPDERWRHGAEAVLAAGGLQAVGLDADADLALALETGRFALAIVSAALSDPVRLAAIRDRVAPSTALLVVGEPDGPAQLRGWLEHGVDLVLAGDELPRLGAHAIQALVSAQRRTRAELAATYADRTRELDEANQQLRQQNRSKDEFLAMCAHDLRSPLNVILGHAKILAEICARPPDNGGIGPQGPGSNVRMVRSIHAIDRQSRRVLELVEDLLERRRTGADKLQLRLQPADLKALLEDCCDAHTLVAQERGIALACILPEEPVRVIMDPGKIHEVVTNLLGNALKFSTRGSRVELRLEVQPHAVRISVTDEGPGIAPDVLPVIFERYRSRVPKGVDARAMPPSTGLGLAICRELVELHGGEIWAQNRRAGGAKLTFTLPRPQICASDPLHLATGTPCRALAGPAAPTGGLQRILLIEDDRDCAQIIAEILGLRYQVEVYEDGATAIERAKESPPDLVVLDLYMPHVDGFTVLERLKRHPRTRELPIVIVSACGDGDTRVRGLSAGAADVLSKPFYPAELLARVEKALNHAEQRERLRVQAHADELTGLGNLRFFRERLREELARTARYRTPLALVLIDLDHLKQINDQFGHDRGSQALITLGETLRAVARETDILARVGGDEFAVLLPSTHGSAALRFAERLRGQLSQRSAHAEGPTLTVSIGISVFDGTAATWPENDGERLLKSADTALYAAKASGRNTIRIAAGASAPVASPSSDAAALGEAGRN